MTFRSLAPAGALALALFLTACDSTSSDPADLRLDIGAVAGSADFLAGQPFDVNGTTGQLDIAQLYLSGITLLHEDGREILLMADAPITVRAQDENENELQHSVDERYVFANVAAGMSPVALGEVPSGRYTGVRFLLGVDGLDNRIAPEDAPADHPLAPKDPSMHWNWNAGYVFLRLDGLLDIDGDGTVDASSGTPRDPASGQWRLHLGGGANLQTVTLNEEFELRGGDMQDLRVQVDLNRFVQGLDFSDANDRWCMTGGCQDVIDTAKDNASGAFSILGVR
ncbi:MAG: MbnP family protein [Bacteroidota bacterium]